MLPLAGQKLAVGRPHDAPLFMSGCVIIAQLVMIPVALFVGRYADSFGRKPIFLAAFIVLPIRGLFFGLIDVPVDIMLIQVLDGIGAGIYGAAFVLVVADLTRGMGCFNLAQGMVIAVQGLGASVSNFFGEWLAELYGYDTAFLALAGIAAAALALFCLGVPETLHRHGAAAATS
ncbi:MAG: MFS transporter [Gemmataceae bacterium]